MLTLPRHRLLLPRGGDLFRDDFNATLNRFVVTDSESKISLANGKLTFASGKAAAAWGDPMVGGPAFVRRAGLTFECEITTTALTTGNMAPGWGVLPTGISSTDLEGLVFGDGAITYWEPGNEAVPFTWAAATSYRLRLIAKATGALYYLSTDNGSSWSLLYDTLAGTTSPIYPAAMLRNGTGCTVDFLRVYQGLVPSPVHTATPASPIVTLGSEMATGNLTVGSWYAITATQVNYFYTSCAVDDYFRATATTALDANNVVAPVTFTTTLTGATTVAKQNGVYDLAVTVPSRLQGGLLACLDDETNPQNYLQVHINQVTGNLVLLKCVSGTTTVLTDTATGVTYAAGRRIRLVVNGNNFVAYYESSANAFTQISVTQTQDLSGFGTKVAAFGVKGTVSYGAWSVRL